MVVRAPNSTAENALLNFDSFKKLKKYLCRNISLLYVTAR